MNTNSNGRVNILGNNIPDVFQLYDRVPVNEKITSYRQALTGNWENNMVSNVYFSADNIQIIQNGIRAGVYKKSNKRFIIGPQDLDTLKIIMRSIFLQHSSNLPTHITQQIIALNKLVTDYCIPQLCGECDAYTKYKNDVSTLSVPLQRPVSTYQNNTLETTNFF